MEGLVQKNPGNIDALTLIEQSAHLHRDGIAMNALMLGKDLIDAKPLVAHGQWESWVTEHAGTGIRQAQQLMSAFSRFGDRPQYAAIGKSNLIKMLMLPEGTEESFVEANDVQSMTAREVEQAVKEYKTRLDSERRLREAAEKELSEMRDAPAVIPVEVTDALREKDEIIQEQQTEIGRISEQAQDAISERMRMKRDLDEANAMLDATEEENRRVKEELHAAQSMIAKGDAERVISERMTSAEFVSAVQVFMGAVSSVPSMGDDFSVMKDEELRVFRTYLKTVENWCGQAMRALETREAFFIG